MHYFIKKTLFITLLLSGCAQTQVPYKVVEVTDQVSSSSYQFQPGIRQTRLDGNNYRITAKLAEVDTPQRAKSMALYHASILAEEKGFNAFIVYNRQNASWCSSSRRYSTGGASFSYIYLNKSSGNVTGGGPSARLFITLVNADESDTREELYFVEDAKESNKILMDQVPTELELQKISDKRFKHCESMRKKRLKR